MYGMSNNSKAVLYDLFREQEESQGKQTSKTRRVEMRAEFENHYDDIYFVLFCLVHPNASNSSFF